MKLTNQEIVNTLNILYSIADKDFPIALTYQLIDIQEKLMQAYQVYDKARIKAKTDGELIELLEITAEVEIEGIDKEELIASGASLSPAQLVGLRKIING